MADLEKSGLFLVAENAQIFFGDIAKASSAVNAFSDTTNKASGSVSASGQVMIGALRKVGAIAVEVFGEALRAGAAFIGDSISLAGDFSQTMSVLGAVSGASADDIARLSDKAKDLGNDLTLPATSAVDAGNAMLELSKAGFSVQDSMDAAKGVLQLAAAAQIDEAQAAEINANALQAFGLSADKSIFVSDLLAASANASSVEITDVAQSYQMAGAVFSAFQGPVVGAEQSIVDLTTAIGILGNAGIKGSDAGTSLKQALLQLTGPSMKAKDEMRALYLATLAEGDAGQNLTAVLQGTAGERAKGLAGLQESAGALAQQGDIAYDATGKMRSFQEILGLVSAATRNLSDEERNAAITSIFGADAARSILVLMKQGPEAWDAMSAAVTRQGAAADLAAAQTTGLKGAWEGAKSQVETLQLTIGQALNPVLEMLVRDYLQPAIASLTSFVEALTTTSDPIAFLVTSIDQVLPGFQSFIGMIQSVATTAPQLATSFTGAFTAIQTTVQTVFGTLQTYIPAVMQALYNVFAAVLPQIQAFWQAHGAEIMAFVQTTWTTISNIINLALQLVLSVVIGTLQTVADFINTHGALIQAILTDAWSIISGVITATLALIQGVIQAALQIMRGDWEGAWTTIQQMSATIVQNIYKAIVGALDLIARSLGMSLQEYGQLWTKKWNEMVAFVQTIPSLVAGVGPAIVNMIKDGFERQWNTFINAAKEKLQQFKDMLPFSEPKDSSSPLYGLGKAGESIVKMLATGMSQTTALLDQARTLGSQMIAQFGEDGKTAAQALADGITRALDFRAAVPRAFDSMDQFMADLRDHLTTQPIDMLSAVFGNQRRDDLLNQIQAQSNTAFSQAQQIAGFDPQAAQQFLQLRTHQIQELADLQEQLLNASGPEAAAIQERIARISGAQTLEFESFLSQIDASGAFADLLRNLLSPQASAGILPQLMASVKPPASASQIANIPQTSSSQTTNNYNLGIQTNQSPAAAQQGFQTMQALYGRA